MNPGFDWQAHIEELKNLVAAGLSASQIARQWQGLGNAPTRSAVLGKIHRLGLGNARPARPKKKRLRPPRQVWRPPPPPPPPPPLGVQVLVSDLPPRRFMQLRENSCRFILGEVDGIKTLYCGGMAERGPYCDHHTKVCYG